MTETNDIKYIDLDEIKAPEVTIKYKGIEHVMKALSVDQFIDNIQNFERMRVDGGVKEEIDVTKKMINIAFPTLTPEILGKMTFPQLDAVLGIARNASTAATNEGEDGENPQPAGE